MTEQKLPGMRVTVKLKGHKSSEVDSETPKQLPEKKVKEPSNGA